MATTLTLVRDGESPYAIVVPYSGTPAEKRAAQDLQKHIEQISGACLPIKTDRDRMPSRAILLGTSNSNRHIRALKARVSARALGQEGFVIRTAGQHLILGGGRPRGTIYAVHAFLEDVLGCRWFTAEVSHVPCMKTIVVPHMDRTEQPAFEYREPFFTEAWDKDWSVRNRCNGHYHKLDASTGGHMVYHPWAHSFYNLVPPADYATSHPEYYSEIDGKRVTEGAQLCLTNRDVLKIATARVEKWIRTHPEARIFSVSQNDCQGACMCAGCARIAGREGSQAGPLLEFVNKIAETISKKHPDRLIDTLAYQYTEKPPLRLKPHANVRVRVAPINNCFGHPIDTCPENRTALDNMTSWTQTGAEIYVWHYNINFAHYLMPFPDLDELQGSLRAYRRLGIKGVFCQGMYADGGGGDMAELRSYVMAKLLWNPDTDAWAAAREFAYGVYGAGGPKVMEYLHLLHDAVRKDNIHFRIYDAPDKVGYLRRDIVDRAEALLDEAKRAVANDPGALRRLRKLRMSLDYVRYANPANATEKARYARILAGKLREFGVTQVREGQPVEEFLKELDKAK